jgi:hypothetical protein
MLNGTRRGYPGLGVGTFVARPREHGAALNHAWLRASVLSAGRLARVVARREFTALDEPLR